MQASALARCARAAGGRTRRRTDSRNQKSMVISVCLLLEFKT